MCFFRIGTLQKMLDSGVWKEHITSVIKTVKTCLSCSSVCVVCSTVNLVIEMPQTETNIPFGVEVNLHTTSVHIDLCPPIITVGGGRVKWFNRIRTQGDDATFLMESQTPIICQECNSKKCKPKREIFLFSLNCTFY